MDSAAIVAAIWNEFADREVRRQYPKGADGEVLRYYSPWINHGTWTGEFLGKFGGNGNCFGWAGFFVEALRIQAIQNVKFAEVTVPDAGGEPQRMLIRSWHFPQPGVAGLAPDGRFLNILKDPSMDDEKFLFSSAQVTDLAGIAGQGNSNPRSAFGLHLIVLYGGTYYDPSYGGLPRQTLAAWEQNAVDGYFTEKKISEVQANQHFDNNGILEESVVRDAWWITQRAENAEPKVVVSLRDTL